MKNGIFFLTYDGYYNFTSGIGTQTKTFLNGIEKYYKEYSKIYGDFEINLIVPDFDKTVYGYNYDDIKYADKIVSSFGGKVYKCDSSFDKKGSNFWTSDNWDRISFSAANIILKESSMYRRVIVICVDPPFLHAPKYISVNNKKNLDIKSVILMYTSAYIHDKNISNNRLKWEQEGFLSVEKYKNIKIGNVCKYMTDHFIKFYGVDIKYFIPYHSSLFINDKDFNSITDDKILHILNKYNIPINKKIIFSFGRASWVKGFDVLLKSLKIVNSNIHLVLLTTEFIEDKINNKYKKLLQEINVSYSLIDNFTRELPIALCQYKRCKIVVCPSRREPFSNIPLEVGLWAKKKGPVVLASNIGGFKEQVINEVNGFLFEVDNHKDLAKYITYVLKLPKAKLDSIRFESYNKVIRENDFFDNFGLLLASLWS